MEFSQFKRAVGKRFKEMSSGPLFQALIDKEEIYDVYLKAFPEGTNPLYRERSEHDCSSCKSFIRNAGSIVSIVNGKLVSIWDLDIEGEYKIVADALSSYVKGIGSIDNVFLYTEPSIGTDKTRELLPDKSVKTWEHLHIVLPSEVVVRGTDIGTKLGGYKGDYDVVERGLRELTLSSIETTLELITQDLLYRGAEHKNIVSMFLKMKRDYDKLSNKATKELFCWAQVKSTNAWVCRIRNTAIGTLLVDLSEGVELEKAVGSYENKVSGTNYKRPKALVTPKMRDSAKKAIEELGLMPSLERRYATLEDIDINNVLFVDRSVTRATTKDVFDTIGTTSVQKIGKVEEVPIEKFLSEVLPTAKTIEVLLENDHSGNFVSLIAPYDATAKTLFKWNNPFSWSYTGDVADSIKERVKSAGGSVVGDLCCRLAWYNYDDLDLHMTEPNGDQIYFGSKTSRLTGGKLDVDMNAGGSSTRTPVENIFYSNKNNMVDGKYTLYVQQYNQREYKDEGFEVEIDLMGTTYSFAYPQAVRGTVAVAEFTVSKGNITIKPLLKANQRGKEIWSLKTLEYHKVNSIMLSPNFWNDQTIGNKHYMFLIDGCRNDGSARGFYNEFLHSDLEPHRKTMELVGSKMRTEEGTDQLSGLGFSSTQRNSVTVRVTSSFVRTIKIIF